MKLFFTVSSLDWSTNFVQSVSLGCYNNWIMQRNSLAKLFCTVCFTWLIYKLNLAVCKPDEIYLYSQLSIVSWQSGETECTKIVSTGWHAALSNLKITLLKLNAQKLFQQAAIIKYSICRSVRWTDWKNSFTRLLIQNIETVHFFIIFLQAVKFQRCSTYSIF